VAVGLYQRSLDQLALDFAERSVEVESTDPAS
jgi:hypothetical protein